MTGAKRPRVRAEECPGRTKQRGPRASARGPRTNDPPIAGGRTCLLRGGLLLVLLLVLLSLLLGLLFLLFGLLLGLLFLLLGLLLLGAGAEGNEGESGEGGGDRADHVLLVWGRDPFPVPPCGSKTHARH